MNDTQFKDNYLQNSFNIEKKKNSNELNYAINLSSKEIKENIGLTENNKLNLIKLDIGNTNKDDVKENNQTSLNEAIINEFSPLIDREDNNEI